MKPGLSINAINLIISQFILPIYLTKKNSFYTTD